MLYSKDVFLKPFFCILLILSISQNTYAKNHYIINIYINSSNKFYYYRDYQAEAVKNIVSFIQGMSVNLNEDHCSIILTELSGQPCPVFPFVNSAIDIPAADLLQKLQSLLAIAPKGPKASVELARCSSLKYINAKLRPDDFFDNTYVIDIDDAILSGADKNPKFNQAISVLQGLKTNADQVVNVEPEYRQKLIYRFEIDTLLTNYDNDSIVHAKYSVRYDFYFSKYKLALNRSDVYVEKKPNSLVFERQTQPSKQLRLIPAEPADSTCWLNIPYQAPNANVLLQKAVFSSEGNNVFNIPPNWCFSGEANCPATTPAAMLVNLSTPLTDNLPLYTLLRDRLLIAPAYPLDNVYKGHIELTGNLVNGFYDHLLYTFPVDFSISIVPPLHFKIPGQPEIILDNQRLLAKAREHFGDKPVTQAEVLPKLDDQKRRLRNALLMVALAAIVFVVVYYFWWKNDKIHLFKKKIAPQK